MFATGHPTSCCDDALPSITGQSGIMQNFPATVQNTSWEFTLKTYKSEY